MSSIVYNPHIRCLVVKTNNIKRLVRDLKHINKETKYFISGLVIISNLDVYEHLQILLKWHPSHELVKWICFNRSYVNEKLLSLIPLSTEMILFNKVESNIHALSGLDYKTNLNFISLSKTKSVSLGAFHQLRPNSNLTQVSLESCPLDRKGRTYSETCEFFCEFPKLTKISLDRCELNEFDLYHLAQCHNLKTIDLSNNPGIGNGIYSLYGMRELDSLTLRNCRLGSKEGTNSARRLFDDISSTPKLKFLDLRSNLEISEKSLADISEIKTLKVLKLSNTRITESGLRFILRNNYLTELHMTSCELPENFGNLISSSCLESLNVRGSDLETSLLWGVSECLTLKNLNIKDTPAAKKEGKDFYAFLKSNAIRNIFC